MFVKQRILNALTKHPKILTFGIGITLSLTFAAVAVMFFGNHSAYA